MDGAVNFFGFVLRATFSRTARPIPLRKLRLRSFLTAFAALIVAANSAAVWAAAPQVTGINLTSGGVGTVIVVFGHQFRRCPENNTVTMGGDLVFGATLLNIVAASPTELTVVVPPNARTGKIRVTTNDGWGERGQLYCRSHGEQSQPEARGPGHDSPDSRAQFQCCHLGKHRHVQWRTGDRHRCQYHSTDDDHPRWRDVRAGLRICKRPDWFEQLAV